MKAALPLCLLCLVMLVVGAAGGEPVRSEGPLVYDSYLLQLPGKVKLSYYEDIDRDGLIDILAVHAGEDLEEGPWEPEESGESPWEPEEPGDSPQEPESPGEGPWRCDIPEENPRHLVVFFQRDDGFPPEPDLRYRVPDDVALIDLGDVNDAYRGQELLMLSGDAVRMLGLPRGDDTEQGGARTLRGEGETLVEVDHLFAHADPERLNKRDFARYVDDAERATLFLPRTTGYRIYYPGDDYTVFEDFPARHSHQVRSDIYRVRTADVQLADVDGDGLEDMTTSYLDQLRVHLQRDGRFLRHADLDLNLQIITKIDREAPEDIENLVGLKMEDFDGDSLADLFVWKTVVQKKAVINDKKQYQLYGNRGGSFALIPDQAFVLKSFTDPMLLDLNGDGRLDMVTGYFELSLANIIKALLSKRFQIDLSFFLHGQQGFPDRPNEVRNFKIRISLSNIDENVAPAVEIKGDYDGDGNLDFLLQTDDRQVEIFLGDGSDRLFEKKASVKLEIYACNDAHVEDFNGDGRDDMAFSGFPDREPYDTGWIHVVLSR